MIHETQVFSLQAHNYESKPSAKTGIHANMPNTQVHMHKSTPGT